jgi:hypothetical protein
METLTHEGEAPVPSTLAAELSVLAPPQVAVASLRQRERKRMNKLYRPSNGTEGECFQEAWCCKCERDRAYADGGPDVDPALGCKILVDTFAFRVTDPQYPKEWTFDKNGEPCCTAFVERGIELPYRCAKTKDMFE